MNINRTIANDIDATLLIAQFMRYSAQCCVSGSKASKKFAIVNHFTFYLVAHA